MTNRVTKGNRAGSSAFRRLTRADLATFDREAKDLILKAMEVGCLGRVSAKGHAILRNNTGGTTSVPRNMTAPNRSAQNARADMRRLLAEHRPTLETPTPPPSSTRVRRPAQQMTVSQAFVEHGAAFSRWFDALPGGLRADQLLEVSFDEADAPSFDPVPSAEHEPTTCPAASPTPEPPRRDRPTSHPRSRPRRGRKQKPT